MDKLLVIQGLSVFIGGIVFIGGVCFYYKEKIASLFFNDTTKKNFFVFSVSDDHVDQTTNLDFKNYEKYSCKVPDDNSEFDCEILKIDFSNKKTLKLSEIKNNSHIKAFEPKTISKDYFYRVTTDDKFLDKFKKSKLEIIYKKINSKNESIKFSFSLLFKCLDTEVSYLKDNLFLMTNIIVYKEGSKPNNLDNYKCFLENQRTPKTCKIIVKNKSSDNAKISSFNEIEKDQQYIVSLQDQSKKQKLNDKRKIIFSESPEIKKENSENVQYLFEKYAKFLDFSTDNKKEGIFLLI